jgi:hypothetical protein
MPNSVISEVSVVKKSNNIQSQITQRNADTTLVKKKDTQYEK